MFPPTAAVRRIGELSGHKIGEEEWYTATVDWILTGYAAPSVHAETLVAPDYSVFLMACQWRTKILFSTREGEFLSIIEYEQPAALELSDREEWEPLLNKSMAFQADAQLLRQGRAIELIFSQDELYDDMPSTERF